MKRTLLRCLVLMFAPAMCSCGLFHGDPNDLERGSGGVGVMQPRLMPPPGPVGPSRPILPEGRGTISTAGEKEP
jgi:hypothetical protein